MNRKLIARQLILEAKRLLAAGKDDSDYVYDPDHKHKPKGGHWEKTEKGWSQKKEKRTNKGNRSQNETTVRFDQTKHPAGKENALTFTKKPIKKKAEQATEDGFIETREGRAEYKAGDFIAQDSQGGKYPIKKEDFEKLYTPTKEKGVYESKPKDVKMFKTDKELTIKTEWGDYTASPGDWVELKPDGSLGAPRKPDVIDTDYKVN